VQHRQQQPNKQTSCDQNKEETRPEDRERSGGLFGSNRLVSRPMLSSFSLCFVVARLSSLFNRGLCFRCALAPPSPGARSSLAE
jgi:hypothetical protein